MKLCGPKCIVPDVLVPYDKNANYGMWNKYETSNPDWGEWANIDDDNVTLEKKVEEPMRIRKRNRFSFFGRSNWPGLKE
jgi:hypothetical protein